MRRRFFRYFNVRIPRKLKKAARYGIKKRIYPTTEEKETAFGHSFIYNERVEYLIVGRHTKWKARVRFAVIKEDKSCIAYFWHRQYDRMITW